MTKHKKIKKNIKRIFFEILIILLAFLIINNQDKIKILSLEVKSLKDEIDINSKEKESLEKQIKSLLSLVV